MIEPSKDYLRRQIGILTRDLQQLNDKLKEERARRRELQKQLADARYASGQKAPDGA